jgi:protein SCO1/2
LKPHLRTALIVSIAVGFVLIVVLATVLLRPYQFNGLVLQSPKPAGDFTLTAAGDKPVSLSDYRGKLVVLYFGYTFCPDVCPTTLAEVTKAVQKLGKKAEDVQVIMVTVDPERDTPERLAEYMAYFDPSFVGLSGTPEEIAAAATPFGIYYQKHEGTAATGYLVDHTATISVLDREGRVKLVWPFGTEGDAMAADLAHLLKEGS